MGSSLSGWIVQADLNSSWRMLKFRPPQMVIRSQGRWFRKVMSIELLLPIEVDDGL